MAEGAVAWAPGSSDPKVAFAEFQLYLREVTPRPRVVPVLVALSVLAFAAMLAADRQDLWRQGGAGARPLQRDAPSARRGEDHRRGGGG
jgi:hypothetical protein